MDRGATFPARFGRASIRDFACAGPVGSDVRGKQPLVIGRYPTPLERLPVAGAPGELWVKRDDLTGDAYGGNKVRKLEHILDEARARRATRIVTFGAAGSHHVLATTLYGRRAGFRVAAILTPQPRTAHAIDNLRAGLAMGLEAHPARSIAQIPRVLAGVWERGDMLVPPGGSNVTGTLGYVDAAEELAQAIRSEEAPLPDAIVVALGSGGTAAGLLAGLVRAGLPTRVVGVRIVEPILTGKLRVASLAMAAMRRAGAEMEPRSLLNQLEVDGRWLGGGYGHSTPAGERATALADERGLALDPTYTAKAFAAALDIVNRGRHRRVLYWHTLSSAPLAPLLENAQAEADLAPGLFALFVAPGS